MAKKFDYIQVPKGTVPKLMVLFGCSKVTVYNALRFEAHSDLAEKIRATAIDSYNGIVSKKTRFI